MPFLLALTALAAPAPPDFSRDVRPILAAHCFTCHGPDESSRKGKLRLDRRDDALKGGRSGEAAIVPGKADKSALIARIVSHEASEVMPPPSKKDPVKPADLDTLRRWIDAGAAYSGHWAFSPPVRPPVPAASGGRAANPIDAFVLAKLREKGLAASPPAEIGELCRRLHLDVTGLPPTTAELDAFAADAKADRGRAVSKLLDRLLASPHYGERWGRIWLDAARYADSDGYEKDVPRAQWIWRDWVVRAKNADMPYDRFLVEQFAGDLLRPGDRDALVATGFLRNSMVNEEGAIIAEQFRTEGVFDRMDCVGKAVLGLSLQCAQCHTHKFDPVTHDEYFSLFAFLNNDFEATSRVHSDDGVRKIGAIRRGVKEIDDSVKKKHPDWAKSLAAWEAERRRVAMTWDVLRPTATEWVGGLAHPEALADGSVLTLGHKPVRGDLWVTAETKLARVTGLRLEALTHGDLPFGGPGRSPQGTYAVSEVVVEVASGGKGDKTEWKKVDLAGATADVSPPSKPMEPMYRVGKDDKRVAGPAAYLVDGKEETAWMPDLGPGRRNVSAQAVIRFAKPVEVAGGARLRVWLKFRHSGPSPYGMQSTFLGRFRLAATGGDAPTAEPYTPDIRDLLDIPADKRTPEQADAVFAAWREKDPAFSAENKAIDALFSTWPAETTTVLHLAERPRAMARPTRLLDRGTWDKPKHGVAPGLPAVLGVKAAGPTRLDLARALVDPKSPTTARVAVNRVWQTVFGTGIVETAEEFGTRGEPPTHPELLDWLATEFTESGWSEKRLLRLILTSSTYGQSAAMTAAGRERDPANKWLSRGPRFRADAETIRDVALRASGLMLDEMGGPSVYPPVPDSLFALSYLPVTFWKTAEGAQRYRRSVYVFRRRSMPDPVLSSFDAPSGETSCVRRGRSNTPLAALTAMNEPVFVESARALARAAVRVDSADGRIDEAFRRCVSRPATAAEKAVIRELVAAQFKRLKEGKISAKEIAGEDDADLAAWVLAARVILNLDETLSK